MKKIVLSLLLVMLSFALYQCNNPSKKAEDKQSKEETSDDVGENTEKEEASKEVNVYSHRHYDSDKKLFKSFEEQTGIRVNVVKASADELINKIEMEGENSPADVLITVDAGRLHRAKSKGLLQPVVSDKLTAQIPVHLRDADSQWFGITKRARVIVYDKEKINPKEVTTYAALTSPKLKGKVLIRSSSNVYNQSLLASIIAHEGEEKAKAWAKGVVENMSRKPKGGDRDQVKAIAAGEGDLAVINTYYLAQMLGATEEAQRKVAQKVGVIFPNQEGRGTHINVSGAGVVKHAKNKANAIKLIEFLTSPEAQKTYVEAESEYPVNPHVEATEVLKSWGDFKEDSLNLSELGNKQEQAILIFDEVGWK